MKKRSVSLNMDNDMTDNQAGLPLFFLEDLFYNESSSSSIDHDHHQQHQNGINQEEDDGILLGQQAEDDCAAAAAAAAAAASASAALFLEVDDDTTDLMRTTTKRSSSTNHGDHHRLLERPAADHIDDHEQQQQPNIAYPNITIATSHFPTAATVALSATTTTTGTTAAMMVTTAITTFNGGDEQHGAGMTVPTPSQNDHEDDHFHEIIMHNPDPKKHPPIFLHQSFNNKNHIISKTSTTINTVTTTAVTTRTRGCNKKRPAAGLATSSLGESSSLVSLSANKRSRLHPTWTTATTSFNARRVSNCSNDTSSSTPLKKKCKQESLSRSLPSSKPALTKMKQQEQEQQTSMAKEAAKLARQMLREPDLMNQLVVRMALQRENPRQQSNLMIHAQNGNVPDPNIGAVGSNLHYPSSQLQELDNSTSAALLPGAGHVLSKGFIWAHYPPLENILKQQMQEYYTLSLFGECQSSQQHAFNNSLVTIIRKAVADLGWSLDSTVYFNDRILRDRIRCYYKTHIQNARKRLQTMLKNPTKKMNARHLVKHLDLLYSTYKQANTTTTETTETTTTKTTAPPAPQERDISRRRITRSSTDASK